MALVAYKYVDDTGKEWSMYLEEVLAADAVKRGLVAAEGDEESFSGTQKIFRPRKCVAIASNGKSYWLVCGTHDCTAYMDATTTLAGVYARRSAVAMNAKCYGYHGERHIHKRPAPPA